MPSPQKISIIGCGTMGHTIALNAALSGLTVSINGVDAADIERAQTGITSRVETLVENNYLDKSKVNETIHRISTSTQIEESVDGASFVIEAIHENIKLKQQLFKQLDQICNNETILASTTSGLHPDEICTHMQSRNRFIIAHFWNPAHLIPLVEVIGCKETSDITITQTKQLLQAMGKKVVMLKKFVPGFIGNRLQFALFREAQFLLEQGAASKEDIDTAVTAGIGRRLPITGPLASADLGGLDVFLSIANYLFPELSNAKAPSETLQKLVAENRLGLKNGEGFYDWTADSKTLPQARDRQLIAFLKKDNGI